MSLEDKRTNLFRRILFMSLEDKRDNLCMRLICGSKMRLIYELGAQEIIYACASLRLKETANSVHTILLMRQCWNIVLLLITLHMTSSSLSFGTFSKNISSCIESDLVELEL